MPSSRRRAASQPIAANSRTEATSNGRPTDRLPATATSHASGCAAPRIWPASAAARSRSAVRIVAGCATSWSMRAKWSATCCSSSAPRATAACTRCTSPAARAASASTASARRPMSRSDRASVSSSGSTNCSSVARTISRAIVASPARTASSARRAPSRSGSGPMTRSPSDAYVSRSARAPSRSPRPAWMRSRFARSQRTAYRVGDAASVSAMSAADSSQRPSS